MDESKGAETSGTVDKGVGPSRREVVMSAWNGMMGTE